MKKLGIVLSILFLGVRLTAAQGETCPAIVEMALIQTDEVCNAIGRNQMCYGNPLLNVLPQEGIDSLPFEAPGDTTSIAEVKAMGLSSLDEETQTWGVALMQVQANLPDTLPGQNVLIVLFGDVVIENAVGLPTESATLQVTALQAANVRLLPSVNDRVIGTLKVGETVESDGRLENNAWLRVRLPDGGVGWVFSELVSASNDVDVLSVVDPQVPLYEPMQAFYFQSGVGEAACNEVPNSGILIQTPAGVGKVMLTINEVDVALGSTVYFEAQPAGEMLVYVLEGEATLTANDDTVTAPAGTMVRVPLDEFLTASGEPGEIEPYDEGVLAALPIALLDEQITIAPALTLVQIRQLTAPVVQVQPPQPTSAPIVQDAPTPTSTPDALAGFYSRPSDGRSCRTGEGVVCVEFNDGYLWLVTTSVGLDSWSTENLNGQTVQIAYFGNLRYAHILGTDLVKGPY